MSANLISIHRWLGQRGEPMEPESMQFTTKPAKGCKGCLFEEQSYKVCNLACDVADLAGMELCEEGFIYVAKPVDPRQENLLDKEH